MEFVLLFLGVLAVGGAAFATVGTRRSREASRREHAGQDDGGVPLFGLVEPVASLPPVLLPERPGPGDARRVRFAVALRGYRCDQVDAVLESLDAEIGRLNAELDDARSGSVIRTTTENPE